MYGFTINEFIVRVVLIRSLNQRTDFEDGEMVFRKVGQIDQWWHDSKLEIQTYGKSKVTDYALYLATQTHKIV